MKHLNLSEASRTCQRLIWGGVAFIFQSFKIYYFWFSEIRVQEPHLSQTLKNNLNGQKGMGANLECGWRVISWRTDKYPGPIDQILRVLFRAPQHVWLCVWDTVRKAVLDDRRSMSTYIIYIYILISFIRFFLQPHCLRQLVLNDAFVLSSPSPLRYPLPWRARWWFVVKVSRALAAALGNGVVGNTCGLAATYTTMLYFLCSKLVPCQQNKELRPSQSSFFTFCALRKAPLSHLKHFICITCLFGVRGSWGFHVPRSDSVSF